MKIQKRHWFIIFPLLLLTLGIETYYYSQVLKIEDVEAVTVGVPNPGHSLAQLECSADSFCVDTTNNRVGIGTANPVYPLDVVGRSRIQGSGTNGGGLWLSKSGTPTTHSSFIGRPSVADGDDFTGFYSATHGWGLIVKDATGNVGIGTIIPSEKLSVAGVIGFETFKKDYTLTLGDGTYTAGTWYALSGNPGAQYGDGMSYLAQISIQYDGGQQHWQHIGSGFISTVGWAASNYSYVTIPLTCHNETAPVTAYLMQRPMGQLATTVIVIKFDTTLTVANSGYIRVYLKRIF